MSLIKVCYPKYIENSYHSTTKRQTTQLKNEQKTLMVFVQRKHTNGQQAHEKVFNMISHRGNANPNHNEVPFHTH